MLHPLDGYTEREAEEMLGKRVTQIVNGTNSKSAEAQKGVIIASDAVQLKPGVQEHCVWIQWDGSDKAHQFGKLNEGTDFQFDGNHQTKLKKQSVDQSICPSGMPPSKQQIDAYKKLLSKPNFTSEMSPSGTITNAYDPHRDRKIEASIRSTEAKLSERKGKAMSSFKGKANEQHLRTRFNRNTGMSM